MNNKTIKIIIMILIFVSILFAIQNKSLSADVENIVEGSSNFVQAANRQVIDPTKINDISDIIYNILLSIGIVAAVIVAAILGIQFMLADMEGQAKVKESLIPFVVGCIIIFGAFGIWRMFAQMGQNL